MERWTPNIWNPDEWCQDMLVNNPIYCDEKQNVWDVFRYDDVNMLLNEFKLFSSIRKRSVSPIAKTVIQV